jgi:hypothetical protein
MALHQVLGELRPPFDERSAIDLVEGVATFARLGSTSLAPNHQLQVGL